MITAGSREATEVVPLKRAPRTTGSPRKQLWVERVAGSMLRLKSGEENSGRSDVGSMNVARPAFASGPSAGSSRGAEGAVSMVWPISTSRSTAPTNHQMMGSSKMKWSLID